MGVSVKTQNLPYYCAIMIFFDYLFQVAINDIRLILRINNVDLIYYCFYLFFALLLMAYLYYNKIVRKQLLLSLSVLFFFGVAYLYTFIINPGALSYITDSNLQYLFLYVPAIVLIYSFEFDYLKLLDYLSRFARFFSFVVFVTVAYDYIKAGYRFVSYDMVLGYQAVLCAIVLVFSLFRQFNYLDLILTSILSSIVLFLASRGAVVVLIAYVLTSLFRKYLLKARNHVKFFFIFISLVFIVFVYYYGLTILQGLLKVAHNNNIYARNIGSLLQNDVSIAASNEGRLQHIYQCVGEWNLMPLFGYGIFSDRKILNGIYAHNFFVEFITDYGFFIGAILIVSFFALIVKILHKKTDKSEFVLIVAEFTVIHLLVSGSYLTSTLFFVLLASLLSGASGKISMRLLLPPRKNEY